MTYVAPDGPTPARFIICGEAPAAEEVNRGRGFVGPSGKMLWPALRRLAGLERGDCYVTNLCKHPLDNSESGDAKMSEEEFASCQMDLLLEIAEVSEPGVHVLAVGALAARALVHDYVRMEVHNGMTYGDNIKVTPCWHPAAALHGDTGKDPLAWMGDALAHFGPGKARYPGEITVPPYTECAEVPKGLPAIGVDTEGLPDDPIILTWATEDTRHYVYPAEVPKFWESAKASGATLVFQNILWDWRILEAMGIGEPWKAPFGDTMELAYLRQTEPQGLKDLSLRHLGLRMRTFEQVVMPYYEEAILAIGAGMVDAGTTVTTVSPKTGKPYKTPKVEYTDEVKPLKRALTNPKLMAARIGDFPGPSLRFVPEADMLEYATLDPYATLKLWSVLR